MRTHEFPSPKKEVQLQGPRPPPLTVSKDSHKIRKPPLPPQPLIIYSVSPKILHVTVTDFMNVVQRLTGPDQPPPPSCDLSPAARLASIERTSPSDKDRVHSHSVDHDLTWLLEGVEVAQFPGVLSPATLPPVSSGFFSPMMEPQTLSPFWSSNSFVASPSGFLSAALVSPLMSPDLFNIFD